MLWLIIEYWESLAAFFLFAVFHSLAAREPFKKRLAQWTSPFFINHYWRLIYCLVSFVWYFQVIGTLHWGLHPDYDAWLTSYPDWLWQTITAVHLGSIAVIYAALLQSDYLEFLGLRQAWGGVEAWLERPHFRSSPKQFGLQRLEVSGVYGWVRHPMLAGGLLYLVTCRPTLNIVVFTAMYALYMIIGSHYEERRLIQIFGRDYVTYRDRVGGFVPRLRSVWPIQAADPTRE
jgi:hypothetical protein